MADTRKITIEITGGDSGNISNSNNDPYAKYETKDEKWWQQVNQSYNNYLQRKQKFISYSTSKASNLAKQALQVGMDRYFSLTEDYIAQNDIRIVKNMIGNTVSFATSIAVGAHFGPVGAAIGAFAWVGDKAISSMNEYSSLRQGINENNYNMQFQRTRMGLVDNGRGTEN